MELDDFIAPTKPIVIPVEPEMKILDIEEELMDLDLDRLDFGTVAGSIGGLNQNIQEFSDLQSRATDPANIRAYQQQIEKLQAQINQLAREARTFFDVMI